MKTAGTGFFLMNVYGMAFVCLCVSCSKVRPLAYIYSYDGLGELIEDQIEIQNVRHVYPVIIYGPQTVQRMREIKICLSVNRVTISEIANLLNLEQMRMGIPLMDRVIFAAASDVAWYDPDLVGELYGPERVLGPPLADIEAKDTSLLDVVGQVCSQMPCHLRVFVGWGGGFCVEFCSSPGLW